MRTLLHSHETSPLARSSRVRPPAMLAVAALLAACGAGGSGGGVDREPPAPPANLELALRSDSAIDLRWSEGGGTEDGFRVERADDVSGAPGAFTVVGTTAADVFAFQDAGLPESTPYWYRVSALAGGTPSEPSDELLAATASAAELPAAPGNPGVDALSPAALRVRWTDVTADEDGFALERAADAAGSPGPFSILASVPADSTEFVDAGVSPASTYWYRVRTVRGDIASTYPAPCAGTTPASSGASTRIETVHTNAQEVSPELTLGPAGETYLRVRVDQNTLVIAKASDRSVLWQREYPGAFRIALAGDGDLWLFSEFGLDAAKLNAHDGTIRWQKKFMGPVFGPFSRWRVPVDANSIVARDTLHFSGAVSGVVDAAGNILWTFAGGDPEDQELSDGGWLLGASSSSSTSLTVARLTRDGQIAWQGYFEHSAGLNLFPFRAFEGTGGRMFVLARMSTAAGGSTFNPDRLWIGMIDGAGGLTSSTTLQGTGLALAAKSHVVDAPDGGRYVCISGPGAHPWVLRLDANGAVTWARRVQGPKPGEADVMTLRPAGGVTLFGRTLQGVPSFPVQETNGWVVALDAAGELEWERTLDVAAVDTLHAVAAGAAGAHLMVLGGDERLVAVVAGDDGGVVSQAAWSEMLPFPCALTRRFDGGWMLVGPRASAAGFQADLVVAEFDAGLTLIGSVLLPRTVVGALGAPEFCVAPLPGGETQLVSLSFTGPFTVDLDLSWVHVGAHVGPTSCAPVLTPSAQGAFVGTGVSLSLAASTDVTGAHAIQFRPGIVLPPPAAISDPGAATVFAGPASISVSCETH